MGPEVDSESDKYTNIRRKKVCKPASLQLQPIM